MTNREKATGILAIVLEELNMPKWATLGDVAYALSILDPNDEVINFFKKYATAAVIDEIKQKIA